MADFEDIIKNLVSSPEGMEQILSVARALTSDGDSNGEEKSSDPPVSADPPKASQGFSLDSLDPKIISTAMSLMSEYNGTSDRRIGLLQALRPYLKENEQGRVDKAIQIVKLSKVAKKAFNSFTEGG